MEARFVVDKRVELSWSLNFGQCVSMYFDDFDDGDLSLKLGGDRFFVVYKLSGTREESQRIADDICAEQTVEFPVRLLPRGVITDKIIGQVENIEQVDERSFLVTISFAEELAASELTQFLNVVFGNISMKLDIQVISIIPSAGIFKFLRGARFGILGIRRLLGVLSRPPLFTALKPMGLSACELAELASKFADGGIDVIKDDHGLSDQPFAPFEERVTRCAAAVRESNERTGRRSIYVPNITAPIDRIFERAYFAKGCGVGGFMISPGLVGLDFMRRLSDEVGLPIIAHPSFIGGMAMNHQGLSCGVLYGTIMRLAGADVTIFPNFGGRFPLTLEDCKDIVTKSREPLGNIPSIFPSPAGGMVLKNIKSMLENYGKDILLLIGSGLFSQGDDLIDNCKKFLDEVGSDS
jgi:ribulose-bisphosphate carboxylase large chain